MTRRSYNACHSVDFAFFLISWLEPALTPLSSRLKERYFLPHFHSFGTIFVFFCYLQQHNQFWRTPQEGKLAGTYLCFSIARVFGLDF